MTWEEIGATWKQFKGSFKQEWGKFSEDDFEFVDGTRDRLIGRLQEKYGMTEQEAERQADRWMGSQKLPAA